MQRHDKPWFRRRRIGVGWQPVSWQGWVITIVIALAVTGAIHAIRH
jgi:hypothetical protein